MNESIIKEVFPINDLNSSFFDSLRSDYNGFDDWFTRKAKEKEEAYIQRNENGEVQAFLYLKIENEELKDVEPHLEAMRRLKIGTFKIEAHCTKLGERFFKKIFDHAINEEVKEVYVTIFEREKQLPLIDRMYELGFKHVDNKGEEKVLVKSMTDVEYDPLKDYPRITSQGHNKFVLGIYPKFHTEIFPDSALFSERYNVMKDVSYTNSIHKIYISFIADTAKLKKGDIVIIYRTSDGAGPAWYRSVVTSVCVVEEVKTRSSFADINEYIDYTKRYSIFSEMDLRKWYYNPNVVILKMTYNVALTKRLNRATLVDCVGINPSVYWGFFPVTDEQFKQIIKLGEVNEAYFIN